MSSSPAQYIPSSIVNTLRQTTGIQLTHQWTSSNGLALHMACGYFLGFCMCLGLAPLLLIRDYAYSHIVPLAIYIVCSSLFYSLEYLWHSLYHPHTLDISAFILFNHNGPFYCALVACFIEYFVEFLFFPSLKQFGTVHAIGQDDFSRLHLL